MTLYTDEQIRAVHEFAWNVHDAGGKGYLSYNAAKYVLDAVAPAIAARALRDFAYNDVVAQTAGRMAEDLLARADEIERGAER